MAGSAFITKAANMFHNDVRLLLLYLLLFIFPQGFRKTYKHTNATNILYLSNNLHQFFNQFIVFILHSATPLLPAILTPYALMLSHHKQ